MISLLPFPVSSGYASTHFLSSGYRPHAIAFLKKEKGRVVDLPSLGLAIECALSHCIIAGDLPPHVFTNEKWVTLGPRVRAGANAPVGQKKISLLL